MACASEQEKYQQWLAQINQVCGRFDARPLEGQFIGELETSYARSLKLSTVTAGGVNLFRTRQEIKTATMPGSIPCFSSKAAQRLNRTTAGHSQHW
jgi:AraC family transcriptional activator of tynA and feaB